MTREEAINAFKEWIEHDKKIEYVDRLENIEIYKLAIKALEQTEPEKCGDCISRQAAKSKAVYSSERHEKVVPVAELDWLPSVEPERKPGKWIEKEDYSGDVYYDCSVCGNSWTTIDGTPWENGMNYCPNCGARMEVENDVYNSKRV